MNARRVCSVILVSILMLSMATPLTLGKPGAETLLQASTSTTSAQGACFGYNGVNDSSIPKTISSLRVALVQPILTATPYSQYSYGSFYAFYAKEQGVTTNVTTNLNFLSTNVTSGSGYLGGWGLSYPTYEFLTSQTAVNCGLVVGKNVQVLTDMDVANGGLFDSQSHASKFDVVVLPFSEYVETSEYQAYESFVAGGGTLVMMAHSLEYPVTYNATTNMETLVYGHNWAFNGKYAYPVACGSNTYIASCPWANNSTDWIGSNSCEASCYHTYVYNGSVVNTGTSIGKALSTEFGGTVFKTYKNHEENTVTNMTHTSILSVFVNDSTNLIASYTHQFKKGNVVNFGFFADDIINSDHSVQYLMLLSIASAGGGAATSLASSTTSSTSSATTPTGGSTSSSSAQVLTSTTVASQPSGGSPSFLLSIGGVAAVMVVVVAAVTLRKRSPKA
jgi:hypothetical protein